MYRHFLDRDDDDDGRERTSTSEGTDSIHTCRSYIHMPRDFTNGASLAAAWRLARALTELSIERRCDVNQPRPAG